MAKATRGSDAQFTYDFGIAIAQSTISKITRLTGVTLSLASAFYALKSTANEYVNTLRENTFRFGGVLSTMKAMEQAQDRLIKGQSYFSVDDQLRGMNQLMAAGINVKKNLDWINKAAHASGQSFAQFSGAISNAIAGNMGQLVDMGLITQRATRMFDKYAANTVMRQQAILNFVKNHKGLMAAIRNDFYTIQDQMRRIKETWKAFLQSVLGKPNDPMSFYGQIAQSMKLVADALAKNFEQIKRVGFVIGQVLGWVMKQIGHFVVWIGKQMKQSLSAVWKMTDNYVEFTRSLIVWLEFWKLKIIDFFKEYGGVIKTVLKLVIAYKALKWAFLIGEPIIKSVWAFAKAIKHCYQLQMAYMAFQGPYIGKTARWFQSLAAWMPQPFRHAWVASGKYLGLMGSGCIGWCNRIGAIFKNLGLLMIAPFKMVAKGAPALLKVILGTIGAIGSAPLAALNVGNADYKGILSSSIDMVKDGCSSLVNTIKDDFVGKVWDIMKNGFGPMFKWLKTGFQNVGNFIMNIPRLVGIAFNSIKGLWAALNASNPVGWVILAITAVVILYNKVKWFRAYVNEAFKYLIQWWKFLWNIIYGAFIAIAVGCKKAWQFLNSYVFQPIANFFKKTWGWIKQMWAQFKDSSVGRFIDRFIVQPLKSLFNWIMKAIRWLLKGAAAILSIINDSLAEQIRKGEKELGMEKSYALSGNYDQDKAFQDDTNYMNPNNWGLGGTEPASTPELPPTNPISDVTASVGGGGGGGTTVNNNMDFGTGAIQIIVQKGEQIDENKLARLVRDTIKDVNREQNMRGGTA